MKKTIAIITSDPLSVNYEIIKKSIFFFKKNNKNKYLFIGSKKLFNKKINTKKKYFQIENIIWNGHGKKKEYLQNSFNKFFELYKKKKVHGLINLPLNKKKFFGSTYPGVTEYIAKKFNRSNLETMLLYNSNFSVSPLTTHCEIKNISKKISIKKILVNFDNIYTFYKKFLKVKKPSIGILGLNPHNSMDFKGVSEEEEIIIPAIKKIRKKYRTKIYGPISPDVSFIERESKNLNSLIGIYHDQVLTTFKYIHKFNAINITLGLPFIRISPDHGTASNIINKNKANPQSFICCLEFFENFYKSI